jgi:hypothetical protein
VKSNHFPRLLYSFPFISQVNAERLSTPFMLLLLAAAVPLVEIDMLVAAALPPVELELLLAEAQPLDELALLLGAAVALAKFKLLLLALLATCCAHPLSPLLASLLVFASLLSPLLVSEFPPLLGRGSGAAGRLLLSGRSSDVLKQFCARGRLSHDGCQPEGGSFCAGSGEDPSGTIAGFSGLQERREEAAMYHAHLIFKLTPQNCTVAMRVHDARTTLTQPQHYDL